MWSKHCALDPKQAVRQRSPCARHCWDHFTFTNSFNPSHNSAAAAAKSLQLCPTLCDPPDGSPPGSAIPGILQARTLEWVAISFSNAWKQKVKVKLLSRVRPSATPWTAAYQAPPSMGFSRQEYWSGVPLPSPMIRLVLLIPKELWNGQRDWKVWLRKESSVHILCPFLVSSRRRHWVPLGIGRSV